MATQLSFNLFNFGCNLFDGSNYVCEPYLSDSFQQALRAVYYGLEYGSRIFIIHAGPGLGKTTLLHYLKRRLQHRTSTLLLSVQNENDGEVLRRLLSEIGSKPKSDDPVMLREQIDETLGQRAGREKTLILLLDYDQDGNRSTLEVLRHFASLEAVEKGVLRIVITTGPELVEPLRVSGLADEIIALPPLTAEEVSGYIEHKLRLNGWKGPRLADRACRLIAEKTSGRPSAIDEICSKLFQKLANSTSDIDSGSIEQEAPDESCIEALLSDRKFVDSGARYVARLAPSGWSLDPHTALLASIVLILLIAIVGIYYQSVTKKHVQKHVAPVGRLPHGTFRGGNYVQLPAQLRTAEANGVGANDLVTGRRTKAGMPLPVKLSAASPSGLASSQSSFRLDKVEVGHSDVGVPVRDGVAANHHSGSPMEAADASRRIANSSETQAPAADSNRGVPYESSQAIVATRTSSLRAKDTDLEAAQEMAAYQIRLGDAYMNLGDYDRARSSYSTALNLVPSKEAFDRIKRADSAQAAEESVLR